MFTKEFMLIKERYFKKIYQVQQSRVDKTLLNTLAKREPKSLYNPGAYILNNPGKRLRPMLVLFSAKAVKGDYAGSYNAAAAVEILHNFTLVHDDIMDNADKRRGLLTVHKKYDVNTAILVGDSLLAVAYELLLKDLHSNAKEIISTFNNCVIRVCEGQSLDKEFELRSNVTIAGYIDMITKKTAAMTEMSCKIGAQIAGGSKAEIKGLGNFGKYLGIAFQIQDDLLDIMGDEGDFGKIIGGDLIEGKKTFIFIHALKKARGQNKKNLQKVIKNKGIKAYQIPKYRKIYEDLGVLELAQAEIERYSKLAINSLNVICNQNEKEVLKMLVNSLLKRAK